MCLGRIFGCWVILKRIKHVLLWLIKIIKFFQELFLVVLSQLMCMVLLIL